MKRVLIIHLFAVVSFFGNAQTNVLFPDTTYRAHWNVEVWDGLGNPQTPWEYYTFSSLGPPFVFPYDTLINTQRYHAIGCSDVPIAMNGYHGAYRKDLVAKKIYIVPEDSTNEYLFYDFSKNVGDTVFNVYSEYDLVTPTLSHVRIDSIDSVLVNTIYLKRFWLHCFYSTHPLYPTGGDSTQWVEMAGGVGGLFSGVMPVTSSSSALLECMNYNDTIYQPNYGGWGACGVFFGLDEMVNDALFSIFPNPSTGIVTVKMKAKGEATIYNLLGEVIGKWKLEKEETKTDLSAQPKGIYFVRITAEGKSYSQKIVKE